jgi:hypothetical protein
MNLQVWSDVQVNVQSSLGTPLTVTAITKANPGVVSYTGTDPTNGDVMLIRANGMTQADYLIARVASVDGTGNTFALEGIDTTDFDTFTSGTATKITFGTAASTLTDVNPSGGEAEDITIRTIHNSQDKSVPGNFTPMVYAFGSYWDPADAALLALRGFGRSKTVVAIAFTFATGVKVYFAGTPTANMAPQGSAGGAVTTPVKVNLRGDITTYSS